MPVDVMRVLAAVALEVDPLVDDDTVELMAFPCGALAGPNYRRLIEGLEQEPCRGGSPSGAIVE
jgi:hypothetical protein